MTDWPPAPAPAETETWTRADLQAGDLVFCARNAGPLTALGKIADEPWRHVGSLIENADGDLMIVENIGPRFCYRPLDTFLDSYDSYGAARLGVDAECIAAANQWMSERVDGGEELIYAWDDLILAGLIATTRRGIFVGQRQRVRAAMAAAAAACKEQLERRDAASLTCSAFVQLAYDDAGSACTIVHERWRNHTTSWPPRVATLDEFFNEATEEYVAGFDDHSVADLLVAAQADDRWVRGTHIELDQVAEIARVLLAAVAGYSLHRPPDEIRDDGRWVTPGDLWRSPTVRARAILRA